MCNDDVRTEVCDARTTSVITSPVFCALFFLLEYMFSSPKWGGLHQSNLTISN